MVMFDLAKHHDFVNRHGDTVLWMKATKCACGVEPDPSRANVNCRACHGTGTRYATPVALRGLVTGVTGREKALIEAGVLDPEDLTLGLSPFETNRLSDYDLVRLTWLTGFPYEGDVLVRGDPGPDRLRFDPVSVTEVSTVDPETGTITRYESGRDYVVTGRFLAWQTGVDAVTPLVGQAYTVAYIVQPDYIVFTSPMERRPGGVNLGQLLRLRKRHLAQQVPA